MSVKVLEVGPSLDNALWCPGALFDSLSDIDYTGVDPLGMPQEDIDSGADYRTLPGIKAPVHEAKLPNDDYDYALFRSVLGMYTIPLIEAGWDDSRDVRFPSNPTTFKDTFIDGLQVVFDALKPGGQIVISEEDTPLKYDMVEERLRAIGFTALELTPYSTQHFEDAYVSDDDRRHSSRYTVTKPDEAWVQARGKYWKTEVIDNPWDRVDPLGIFTIDCFSAAPGYRYTAYIMTAAKPKD